jgi:hypothetical protein
LTVSASSGSLQYFTRKYPPVWQNKNPTKNPVGSQSHEH